MNPAQRSRNVAHPALNVLVSLDVHQPIMNGILKILPPGSSVEIIPMMRNPERVAPEKLKDREILICQTPPANFQDITGLQWIQLATVGYSQLYGLELTRRGIRATNARGVYDSAIAEWCIAMMVNLARDAHGMFRNQQQRIWDQDARFQKSIRGCVLGIYGYGGIGRETARLAKCFGLTVWVLTRRPPAKRVNTYLIPGTGDPEAELPDRLFNPDQKFEFLAGLDFLLLAMPHTPQTESIIGAAELDALPRSAFILNPARGPLIKEDSLVNALRSGRLRGAALDTHYRYPLPPDHPLWGFENVILTPHISGSTENQHFLQFAWELFSENISRFVHKQPLLNELTTAELNGM